MENNLNLGGDVLVFLNTIVPDTPETRRVEQQELLRLALTQAMRDIRKQTGITQNQLAQSLGVDEIWISQMESANCDRTLESVVAYLDALGAKLELSIILAGKVIPVNLPMRTPAGSKPDTLPIAVVSTNRGD